MLHVNDSAYAPIERPVNFEAFYNADAQSPRKGGPTFDFDFAQGFPALTYTRAGNATRVNEEGLIETVGANLPRITHEPGYVKNELLWSEDFYNDAWQKTSGGIAEAPVITPKYAEGPFGHHNAATRVVFNAKGTTATDRSNLFQNVLSVANPHDSSHSIWVKSNTGENYTLYLRDSSTASITVVNATGSWQRFTVEDSGAASTFMGLVLWAQGNIDNSEIDVLVWGAMSQLAPTAYSGYVRTLSSGVVLEKRKLGLLVEETRTNICLRSQELTNAAWAKAGGGGAAAPTVTDNYATAPDGTKTAARVQADVSGGAGWVVDITQTISGQANPHDQTVSVWLKTADGTTRTVVLATGSTIVTKTVTSEWQRFSVTENSTATTTAVLLIRFRGVDALVAHDILAWGGQIEIASSVSSYIPTTTAAVTRNADVVRFDSASLPKLDNPGSLIVETTPENNGSLVFPVTLDNNDAGANSLDLAQNTALTARFIMRTGGVLQCDLNTVNAASLNSKFRTAVGWATNDFAAVLNGGNVVTDVAGSIPSVASRGGIGYRFWTPTTYYNGVIHRIAYKDTKIDNDVLKFMSE